MKINLVSDHEALSENCQFVRLSGELDIHSAPQFKEDILMLLTRGCTSLLVDLNELNFMDSRGLGVFIGILKAIKECNGTLKIICSNQTILKIFHRTGLNEVFQIFDSLEKAQNS